MSTPINWYKQDPDYYRPTHPNYREHMANIARNLKLDRLIGLSSADGSYSITVKNDAKQD